AVSGRVVDDLGDPVTDATVFLSPVQGGRVQRVKTNGDGRYEIRGNAPPGEYRIRVESTRYVSEARRGLEPTIAVKAGVPVTRDFTLKRGCSIRIQALDAENEQPIAKVRIYSSNASNQRIRGERISTDRTGWAEIGGLPPGPGEYLIGTTHE